jgi:predicted HTH transcriptional regulator
MKSYWALQSKPLRRSVSLLENEKIGVLFFGEIGKDNGIVGCKNRKAKDSRGA